MHPLSISLQWDGWMPNTMLIFTLFIASQPMSILLQIQSCKHPHHPICMTQSSSSRCLSWNIFGDLRGPMVASHIQWMIAIDHQDRIPISQKCLLSIHGLKASVTCPGYKNRVHVILCIIDLNNLINILTFFFFLCVHIVGSN